MKNPYEVLKRKEQELAALIEVVHALKIAAPFLYEEEESQPGAVEEIPVSEMKRRWPNLG